MAEATDINNEFVSLLRYWLFRSWGRIGTTIGGSKVESCSSASEAVLKFENHYTDKTENLWELRNNFVKVITS